MAAAASGGVRFLFLHGFGQCRRTFQNQTASLCRVFKKAQCSVVHLDAPFFTTPREGVDPNDSRSWWETVEKEGGRFEYQKLEASIDLIATEIAKEKDCHHGLLGFSQGACMVSIITALANAGDPRFKSLRLAIMVGGFIPRDQQLVSKYYRFGEESNQQPDGAGSPPSKSTTIFTIPALHVFGEADPVVVPERSAALAALYANGEVIKHPGSHFIPANAAYSRLYLAWLEKHIGAFRAADL